MNEFSQELKDKETVRNIVLKSKEDEMLELQGKFEKKERVKSELNSAYSNLV